MRYHSCDLRPWPGVMPGDALLEFKGPNDAPTEMIFWIAPVPTGTRPVVTPLRGGPWQVWSVDNSPVALVLPNPTDEQIENDRDFLFELLGDQVSDRPYLHLQDALRAFTGGEMDSRLTRLGFHDMLHTANVWRRFFALVQQEVTLERAFEILAMCLLVAGSRVLEGLEAEAAVAYRRLRGQRIMVIGDELTKLDDPRRVS